MKDLDLHRFLINEIIFASVIFFSSNCWAIGINEMSSDTYFAIVDVETTGLDPDYNEIIDIGLILVNQALDEKGKFYTKVNPSFPERINPIAKQINGYDPRRWHEEGSLSEQITVNRLVSFLQNFNKKPIFIAFNSWFDVAFLRKLLSDYDHRFDDIFDYKVLDIPSMALACGFFPEGNDFNARLAASLNIKPETSDPLLHTGESGAAFNYEILKSLKEKDCF